MKFDAEKKVMTLTLESNKKEISRLESDLAKKGNNDKEEIGKLNSEIKELREQMQAT